jgi:hypothetical protein
LIDSSTATSPPPIKVLAYADADWANDKGDRKSITGWVTQVDGDIISWAAKKQHLVAQSTCEAELYAEGAAINEVIWIRNMLSELGLIVESPSVIYGDNKSTKGVSENGLTGERTKHVDIKWHYIKDIIDSGIVKLVWIPSDAMLADIFTKALGKIVFTRLRKLLLKF